MAREVIEILIKPVTIRAVLTIAFCLRWEIQQLDVKECLSSRLSG